MIWKIDWDRALAGGTLDGAILNIITDDLAINGCRPEFVEWRGRSYLATADYGDNGNALRLYDPSRLRVAGRTSAHGVLVHAWRAPAFVQSMCWVTEQPADAGELVLAQNTTAGRGHRLGRVSIQDDATLRTPLDLPGDDELEGVAVLPDGTVLTLSASHERNMRFWSIALPADDR